MPFAAAHGDNLQSATGTSGLTAPSNADSLGPAASSNSTGGSSADSATLQPAGTSPLQSGASGSNGLTAPNGDALQAPATGNPNLQVIIGDGDGSTHNLASSSSPWVILWWSLGIGLLITLGFLLFSIIRRRKILLRTKTHSKGTRKTDPVVQNLETAESETEPTSSQRLNVIINKPATEVFTFLLDPNNTPTWVSFIASEETNEWPPKLGTVYKNRSINDDEQELKLTDFKPDESFVMSKLSNTYHVRYSITPLNEDQVELEYYEWMDEGNLAAPFTSKELNKLKTVIESDKTKKEDSASSKETHAHDH